MRNFENYPIWDKYFGRISAGGSVFIMHISHALITCELKDFSPCCRPFTKLLFPPLQSSHKRKVKFENETLLLIRHVKRKQNTDLQDHQKLFISSSLVIKLSFVRISIDLVNRVIGIEMNEEKQLQQ